jgi:hypothetical protein
MKFQTLFLITNAFPISQSPALLNHRSLGEGDPAPPLFLITEGLPKVIPLLFATRFQFPTFVFQANPAATQGIES